MPILNKIDLPSAHPDEVAQEVEDVIGLPCLDAPRVSAKTGLNVDQVLERVVSDIPAPTGDPDAPLKALIFDSIYDSYKGVIVYIRVFEGTVKPGDTIPYEVLCGVSRRVPRVYRDHGQIVAVEDWILEA